MKCSECRIEIPPDKSIHNMDGYYLCQECFDLLPVEEQELEVD